MASGTIITRPTYEVYTWLPWAWFVVYNRPRLPPPA